MHFKILDKNVSLTMNVFLVIANIINIVYNLPQVIKTYKTKSTGDFSEWFLFLRIVGNIIWIGYSIEIDSLLMLINNLVTVLASLFIGYYKAKEIMNKKKVKAYDTIIDDNYEPSYNISNNLTHNLDNSSLVDIKLED